MADLHTHPGPSEQSDSDRTNPIISTPGHIALIVPRFAEARVLLSEIGMFRYLGGKRWHTVPREQRRDFLYIGL